MKKSICVICIKCGYDDMTRQLLCKAHELAKIGDFFVYAICVGDYFECELDTLYCYGADEVIYIDGISNDYIEISFNIASIINSLRFIPKLIMFSASQLSKSVAADLAVRMCLGLTAECMDIHCEKIGGDTEFVFTRSALNSSSLVLIKGMNSSMNICTCKSNSFREEKIQEINKHTQICRKINAVTINHSPCPKVYSELEKTFKNDNRLQHSKIIFGIGRGVCERIGLDAIMSVASKLNATICGTRAAVESKLIDACFQVGQSGKCISPDIYIAVGISGASQHIAGIKGAKSVVAINTDKSAPIFEYANYCIVDDYRDIFYELLKII